MCVCVWAVEKGRLEGMREGGGDGSVLVLKETMPAVQPKAKMKPDWEVSVM